MPRIQIGLSTGAYSVNSMRSGQTYAEELLEWIRRNSYDVRSLTVSPEVYDDILREAQKWGPGTIFEDVHPLSMRHAFTVPGFGTVVVKGEPR